MVNKISENDTKSMMALRMVIEKDSAVSVKFLQSASSSCSLSAMKVPKEFGLVLFQTAAAAKFCTKHNSSQSCIQTLL